MINKREKAILKVIYGLSKTKGGHLLDAYPMQYLPSDSKHILLFDKIPLIYNKPNNFFYLTGNFMIKNILKCKMLYE